MEGGEGENGVGKYQKGRGAWLREKRGGGPRDLQGLQGSLEMERLEALGYVKAPTTTSST